MLPKILESKEYIEYDLDDINYRIYNDLPLGTDDEVDSYWEIMDKMIQKGETYKLIPGIPTGHHFITSYGRVINAKRCYEMTITSTRGEYIAFTASKRRWKICDIMKEVGFEYDEPKILEYYKATDYPYNPYLND
jgi:hypothetical protein